MKDGAVLLKKLHPMAYIGGVFHFTKYVNKHDK